MLVFGGAKGWFGGNLGFRRFGKRLRWRFWFSTTRRAVRMRISFPAARAWGAPLPYTPSGDGVREGCDPFALSRGWAGGNFGFRRCRKRLRWRCRFSMTQRAVRMRFHFRRCRKRLRWRCWLSTARRAVRVRIWFPTARAWGAPLPYTPSGDGVREGCDPLALSRGAGLAGIWISDGAKAFFWWRGCFFVEMGAASGECGDEFSGAFRRGGGRAFFDAFERGREFFIGLRRMDSCANGF